MPFQCQIEDGIQQWMSRADKGSQRLALRGNQVFFKGDPLIPGQHRLPQANEAVPIAYGRRNMGDFIAAGLPLPGGSAKPFESFQEKRFNIVGLEASGLRARV